MARRTPIRKQILAVHRSVIALGRDLERLARSLQQVRGTGAPRRRLRMSPRRRAALKLHGRYIGYVRQLKVAQKARVKAVQTKKGYHAAIKLARRLLEK